MNKFLSVIILVLLLSSNFMFSQFEPKAYSIHIGKSQIDENTFVTSVIIFHSFDNDKLINELEKEFGVFEKARNSESVFHSYSSSKIKHVKWSKEPFSIYVNSKKEIEHGTYNERNTKQYFKGKLVDIPRKTTIFYMLNDKKTDILFSKKAQKKVKKYLSKIINRITKN